MNKKVKQESSIPVQARVSLMDLAKLVLYWEEQGYSIRSMSQLVGWSLSLMCEVLGSNELTSNNEMSVVGAMEILERRSLFQKSLKDRSFKKIGAAIRMEGMRREGVDPEIVDTVEHNILHNTHSVQPFEGLKKYDYDYESPKMETDEERSERARKIEELVSGSKVKEKMTGEEADTKMEEIEAKDKLESDALKDLDLDSLRGGVVSE